MLSGKSQAGTAPTAFGSMLQASTYGMTIPRIYGRTTSALLAIWANNLRQGGSLKKFKQMKKGITAYCENIDFLLGLNPILGMLQAWQNNSKLPLTFATYSPGSWTIPDADFVAVIGVTFTVSYSEIFNDYGGPGSTTVSGTQAIPAWNAAMAGPDPTAGSDYRNWPYIYRWRPSDGPTIHLDTFPDGTPTVYYAKKATSLNGATPLSRLRLQFENVLGSGTEYNGFSSEQRLYPHLAGVGSDSYDLGSTGTIPAVIPEVQGSFGITKDGDCDFVDMIEDVVRSGIMQSAIDGTGSFSASQFGVAGYDYPGCIQRKTRDDVESFTYGPLAYTLPVTAGNFLIVIISHAFPASISDTLGNSWTPVFSSGQPYQLWYAKANASGMTTVTIPSGDYNWNFTVLEIAGVDTFDSVVVGSGGSVSLTTTNSPDFPAYLLAVSLYQSITFTQDPNLAEWQPIVGLANFYGRAPGHTFALERRVNHPGTFSVTMPGTAPDAICMLAFKCTQPPSYPKPMGGFLDRNSLELTRSQCRAGGLFGSLAMTSQKAATEWVKDLCDAANCAPVWSGQRLKFIPRSEVSAVGGGAVYISPTAGGPVANLDADKGDFIAAKGESAIVAVRKARTDLNTVLQMQHLNRNSDYQQVVTSMTDPASVQRYGTRKADPVVNNAIQDVSVAASLLRIMVRRRNYVEPLTYQFKLNARWQMLEAMDLVTLTDRLQGIVGLPVRLTRNEEDDNYDLTCEAEPFFYGIHAPQQLSLTAPTPYRPAMDGTAGSVNAPIIFEPTPRLYGSANQAQLWVVVSSSAANYGGAQVYISTDGGSSYNPAGNPLTGSAATGVTTASWASASDPDTTNDLAIDLTESLGTLDSYSITDEDTFLYPCYVAGGGTYSIPYELMSYAVATLTAANKYTLKATGGGTNKLRRGICGAPSPSVGVSHASGSRWALLSPSGQGILKLPLDPAWIGKTLYFKIISFNDFGTAVQSLSAATAYSYTVSGVPSSIGAAGGFLVNGS